MKAKEIKLFLRKDKENKLWYFSMIPFEKLSEGDKLISANTNDAEWLDDIYNNFDEISRNEK